ncbi:MAG: phosphate acetyltransferase [Paludibacteraceae bacterium]|nr:phosphate acetyltransferase [Paludibacteraceae bacterium]
MELLKHIKARAQKHLQRIVLPEGTELRTLTAANNVIRDKVAKLILLGNPSTITQLATENNLTHINEAIIVNPDENPELDKYATLLYDLRKSKGMSMEQAIDLAKNPLYLGCLMIKAGDADGELAGAQNTTGNVLRPALQIVKTLPGVSCVSGALMLFSKEKQFGENGMLMVADVAVMPNPTAEELAQIAVTTGHTMRAIAGIEPRIAMLSFSTKGSASHELVDKVTTATKLAQQMAPDMSIDGELQADAAIVPSVAALKAPNSKVAGFANTLVFPSIEVGNIGYKLVQRLGGAQAIGPVLQGMAAPVNDLSRGCSVSDIEQMIAITANQAIAAKHLLVN